MTALVPYASSSDEDEPTVVADEDVTPSRPRKRLAAFLEADAESRKPAKVHTSLGIAATKPLKGDWLSYAFIPSRWGSGKQHVIARRMASLIDLFSYQSAKRTRLTM
jgi:hypothetical protein